MKLRTILLMAFAALLLASLCYSQITQTGTLNGTVYDDQKNPLPGVSVIIKSPALILAQMQMITTRSGHFRFPALSPGTYTVTFKLDGFKTVIREEIKVNVGVSTTLDVTLELSTIEESITVVGQSPVVDIQRSSLVVNLGKQFLQSIPATRDLNTFFNMVPGVTSDTTHGSGERDNTYNLDGVNISDPVVGTRAGQFSLDIMEELSVHTAGNPAEYGSVRGGVVNVVTKSGGNKFSGQVNFFYNEDKLFGVKLQADNTKGTIFEGQKSGFDYEIEPGFNLGGPLIKDKLWFFGNVSFRKSQEYLPGYPPEKQPENVPLDYLRIFPYLKLTFQISEKDKLVLSYNFSNYIRHHRDAAVNRSEDATWMQRTPVHVFNIQWTRFFSSNLFMNVKVAYMDYLLWLIAKNDGPRYYDSVTRQYSGNYGYTDHHERNRFQSLADATLFVDDWLGSHEIKVGVETEYSWDLRPVTYTRDSRSGLGPYITLKSGVPDYVTHYQNFTRKDNKFVIGGFIQDSWNPVKKLSVNFGLRFDHQEGILPKQGEDREVINYGGKTYDPAVRKTSKPIIWNTLSPRIGVSYDLFGDGKTAIKASFGRYHIATIMQWFVTVNPNSFTSYRYRLNPDFTPKGDMYSLSATSAAKMDPNLKVPYIDELTIGAEREVIKDLKIGVRYIRKWDRNLIEGIDMNALNFEALMRGDDIFSVWTNYKPVTVVDPFDGHTVTFWDKIDEKLVYDRINSNPPQARRDYDGLEVTLEKRLANRWQASASYVYAHSRGLIGLDFDDSMTQSSYFETPNAHINAMGDLEVERKHQFKLQGIWQGPWGINLSFYYRYLDGRRWTRIIRSQDLGLSLLQGNSSIYAEKRGSRKYPGLHQLDLRLEKRFVMPSKLGNLAVFVDIFNLPNFNTTTSVNTVSSGLPLTVNNQPVYFGETTGILDPRVIKFGFRYEF